MTLSIIAKKIGFITKDEAETCSPLPVPLCNSLGVDYNWARFQAGPYGIGVGLPGLNKFSIENICMALMHEYTQWEEFRRRMEG